MSHTNTCSFLSLSDIGRDPTYIMVLLLTLYLTNLTS